MLDEKEDSNTTGAIFMGEMREMFNGWKEYRNALCKKFGIECSGCKIKRPKACPTIMLPQQVCNVCGNKDERPLLTKKQINGIS